MKTKIIILILFVAIYGCKKKKEDVKEETTTISCLPVSFSTDIVPILQNYSCTSSYCHGSGTSSGGVSLQTHTEITSVDENVFLGAIKHTAVFTPMPNGGGKLTNDEIKKIECWINDGKKDD